MDHFYFYVVIYFTTIAEVIYAGENGTNTTEFNNDMATNADSILWIEKVINLWKNHHEEMQNEKAANKENGSVNFWIAGQIQFRPFIITQKERNRTTDGQIESKKPIEDCKPSDCADVQKVCGQTESGIYTIYPTPRIESSAPITVYCDLKTEGGRWTVFQRRGDYGLPEDYFNRPWSDYKKGFGDLAKEFWLGNDALSILTRAKDQTLRIELEDFEGGSRYAEYEGFKIMGEDEKYRLIIGKYKGNAGDSLTYHNNSMFSTKDSDNDSATGSCSTTYKGAWWYSYCGYSNLNGLYLRGKHESSGEGVEWEHWKGRYYSLKKTEMKFRLTT